MKSIKRVHKQYDEKMKVLLDAAASLFIEKGYQKTTVQDIIDKVGVAKGTFYHYFEAKEDILHELAERFIDLVEREIERIVVREDCSAMEKLRQMADFKNTMASQIKMDYMLMIMMALYMDENLELRRQVVRTSHIRFAPLMARIIRQGNEEGDFNVTDPENMALILMMMDEAVDELAFTLLLKPDADQSDIDKAMGIYLAYEEVFCRMLGIKEGELHFMTHMVTEEELKQYVIENKALRQLK